MHLSFLRNEKILMFKKIVAVYPLENLRLLIWFESGEAKTYDVAPLLKEIDAFKALDDPFLFQQACVDAGGYGISWNDDIDLACNELYGKGTPIDVVEAEKRRLIQDVASSRAASNLTQAQLKEASGVSQPMIARMEAGGATPRIDTVLKLLAPMGKTLSIVDLSETSL